MSTLTLSPSHRNRIRNGVKDAWDTRRQRALTESWRALTDSSTAPSITPNVEADPVCDLRTAIVQAQRTPFHERSIAASALLLRAFLEGCIDDCGYHPNAAGSGIRLPA